MTATDGRGAGGEAEAGAVIDRFGGEDRRPSAWFTPGREGVSAPDAELEASLRLYLHNLPCRGGGGLSLRRGAGAG
jgi:hypothetical protein